MNFNVNDALKEEMMQCRMDVDMALEYVDKIVEAIVSPDLRNQILGFEMVNTMFPVDYTTLRVFRMRVMRDFLRRVIESESWKHSRMTNRKFFVCYKEDKMYVIKGRNYDYTYFSITAPKMLQSILEKPVLNFKDIVESEIYSLTDACSMFLKTGDMDKVVQYKRLVMLDSFDTVFANYLREKISL